MSARLTLIIAAISGFLSVALGAFAAHGLRGQLSAAMYDVWQTAVQYQMFHTLVLLALGILLIRQTNRRLRWAAALFTGGILLFSGSLYLLALSGTKVLGMITPLGGCLFLAAWLLLALGSFSAVKETND